MHCPIPSLRHIAIASLLAIPAAASAQIVAGKTNTFEDGTSQGWTINLLNSGGVPAELYPSNVATGGPAGVNDNYLKLTSIGGSGGGSRLTALTTDWGGNWLAAGITKVRFNAINFGNTDLTLRLMIEDANGGPSANMAISAIGIVLASGGTWETLEFDLFGPNGLTALLGSVDGALTSTTVFRIFHGTTPTFPGDQIAATLGIDNITAVGTVVPEPSSVALFAVGAVMLLLVRRRTR